MIGASGRTGSRGANETEDGAMTAFFYGWELVAALLAALGG